MSRLTGTQLKLFPDQLHVGWMYCYIKEPSKYKEGTMTPACVLIRIDMGKPHIHLFGDLGFFTVDRDQLRPLILSRLSDIRSISSNFTVDKEQLKLWLKTAK